ncbi:MAG: methyltransferase domain-containing protein [Bacteroidota bacterium]
MDIKEAKNRKSKSTYRHPWELARVEIVRRFLVKITQGINPQKINIIDIGCGDLFVLETIGSHFNFKSLIGIDIGFDLQTIKLLENKYENTNMKIYNDLNQVSVNEDEFSIILLLDVVEHIKEDKIFLSNLYNYNFVNDKATILITVPSFQSLFCSHDDYMVHFRRYSNFNMVKLLYECNYTIQKKGYFFFSLLLPRLLIILKEKILKKKPSIDVSGTGLTTWNHGKFTTDTLKQILLLDFTLMSLLAKFKITLPGLSNYVICKKSV